MSANLGIMEQVEDGKEDHNILAKLIGEEALVDEKVKEDLKEFVLHVFDHRAEKDSEGRRVFE